jgi:DNA repair exonuclease SbcCD ATPase subunit
MKMNEKIASEVRDTLKRKLTPRIEGEIRALQAARKEQDELFRRIMQFEKQIENIHEQERELEGKIEAEIVHGNTPSALIRDKALKVNEIEAVRKQMEKHRGALAEAEKKVQAATQALGRALWRELPALRDEVEQKARDLIVEAVDRMQAWSEAFREAYQEHGLRPDRNAGTRLALFYGLQDLTKLLQPYTDTSIDPNFALAKRREMGIRG